jgi:hypothetical protein
MASHSTAHDDRIPPMPPPTSAAPPPVTPPPPPVPVPPPAPARASQPAANQNRSAAATKPVPQPPAKPQPVTTPTQTLQNTRRTTRQNARQTTRQAGRQHPPANGHAAAAQPPPPRTSQPTVSLTGPSTGQSKGQLTGPPTADPSAEQAEETAPELSIWNQWSNWLKTAPAWLVSLVFHMALLLVLALMTFPVIRQTILDLEIGYSEDVGEQLDSFELSGLDDLNDQAELAFEQLAVEDLLAAPPEITFDPAGLTLAPDVVAPSIGFALTGREEGAKERLLAAFGGTGQTEAAVQMGLEWLKRIQDRDGSWRLDGPYSNGAIDPNRTAATAMALLAFQGAGHTHQSGAYRAVVQRGFAALLKMQDKDGNFFQQGPRHHRLYSHAQATIAICELYGMTKDENLREPAERALEYCVRTQAKEGGWRYEPKFDSDVSVTGWFVMALQSGRMAGLDVPSSTLENVTRYLDDVQLDGGSQYPYQAGGGPKISMTAEGLLCRQYLGWQREDPRLQRGAEKLLENLIREDRPNRYYWYYATQVLHHMGGREWFTWNDVMRDVLPKTQVTEGREKGSWDPSGDPHDQQGGRLYTTCLSIYMLEVYYRHMPIYQKIN